MDSFVQSPLAWIITTALAVISVLIAIFKKKKKELKYEIRSYELIHKGKNQIEGLSHSFRGESIENLTVSKVFLWNNGNVSLRSNDIVPKRPLTISTRDGSSILEKSIIYQREESNSFVISKSSESQFLLDFDCIGKQEGVVLEVYHTGDSAALGIDCLIIDGKVTNNNESTKVGSFVSGILWTLFLCIIVFFLCIIVIDVLCLFLIPLVSNTVIIILGVVITALFTFTVYIATNTGGTKRRMHLQSKFLIGFDKSKDLKK